MAYKTRKTKTGVAVTSSVTHQTYHVKSMAAAKQLERQHEMFKHMKKK